MIDCHTHLEDDRLLCDVGQIIGDFEKDGIEFVIDGSSNYDTMKCAYELAQKYDRVYTTIGCHPNDAAGFDKKTADLMQRYSANNKVLAVGEIGLDYHYDEPSVEIQHKAFIEQLALADAFKLPAVLHIRDAYGDALKILQDNKTLLKHGVVLHCYSGSSEIAQEFLKLDCYFCFGGAITFKNAKKEEIIKSIPQEKLLTETDAPYMTPEPFRGKTNYPKFIKYTYQKMCEVLGISFDKLQDVVRKNTFDIFTKLAL